jgi:hypothetical protein
LTLIQRIKIIGKIYFLAELQIDENHNPTPSSDVDREASLLTMQGWVRRLGMVRILSLSVVL